VVFGLKAVLVFGQMQKAKDSDKLPPFHVHFEFSKCADPFMPTPFWAKTRYRRTLQIVQLAVTAIP